MSGAVEGKKAGGRRAFEHLRMDRRSMALPDRMIRVFNGRGAASVRDKTVTGLQGLQFPPVELRDYRFQLAFFDRRLGGWIQDVVADVYDYYRRRDEGLHPLGLNFAGSLPVSTGFDPRDEDAVPAALLLQHAAWEPNRYWRKGTFHKLLSGSWRSFAIETVVSVSAVADEVYLEVRVTNRGDEDLDWMVCAEQRILDHVRFDDHAHDRARHEDAFTVGYGSSHVRVSSDLEVMDERGWGWVVPARSSATARFCLHVAHGEEAPEVPAHDAGMASRVEEAALATVRRWEEATARLPRVAAERTALAEFYDRCLLTVLECRWERESFVVRPFYAVGSWLYTIAWDTSFAAKMLSLMDPAGLKKALVAYLEIGLLTTSWLRWDGYTRYWYAQTPFAQMRILQEYIAQTGDSAVLDEEVGGLTVREHMRLAGVEIMDRFGRDDLLDFGSSSRNSLEIRTDGYQHVVAAMNGLAARYYWQLAAWCDEPHRATYRGWAERIQRALEERLWDERAGWYTNLHADGSRQTVWSYHLFELLDSPLLDPGHRAAMVAHLDSDRFLGEYGLYSISPRDEVHFDREDVDWGGGGQYVGMPLRIAEALYLQGHPETAWRVLSRCLRWTEAFPYFPQEIFADRLEVPAVEMPLELSAGSGVQAVIHGVFGLRLQGDGTLEVAPARNPELGTARLAGYRFGGRVYDVTLAADHFEVARQGEPPRRGEYGAAVVFAP